MTPINEFETRLLYWTAYQNDKEAFKHFLKKKCSPFMINYEGYSAFHIASAKGHLKILKIILESAYEY